MSWRIRISFNTIDQFVQHFLSVRVPTVVSFLRTKALFTFTSTFFKEPRQPFVSRKVLSLTREFNEPQELKFIASDFSTTRFSFSSSIENERMDSHGNNYACCIFHFLYRGLLLKPFLWIFLRGERNTERLSITTEEIADETHNFSQFRLMLWWRWCLLVSLSDHEHRALSFEKKKFLFFKFSSSWTSLIYDGKIETWNLIVVHYTYKEQSPLWGLCPEYEAIPFDLNKLNTFTYVLMIFFLMFWSFRIHSWQRLWPSSCRWFPTQWIRDMYT